MAYDFMEIVVPRSGFVFNENKQGVEQKARTAKRERGAAKDLASVG